MLTADHPESVADEADMKQSVEKMIVTHNFLTKRWSAWWLAITTVGDALANRQ